MKRTMTPRSVEPRPMLGIIGFAIVGYLSARRVIVSSYPCWNCITYLAVSLDCPLVSLGRFKLASFSGLALTRTSMTGSRPIPGIWNALNMYGTLHGFRELV